MPSRRGWDAEAARERGRERRSAVERRRQRRPARVPADNVYALLERVSRRESVAARGDLRSCAICGRLLTPETLTIDHTVARALGGADSPDNLQATCQRCNNLKSRLEAAVQALRERGAVPARAADEVLASIPNAGERERFADHESVRPLLELLATPET